MPEVWRFTQCDHDGRLLVGVNRDTPETERELHSHEFDELVIVVRGEGDHILGESAIPIHKGNVFVVLGDMVHGYRNRGDLSFDNIIFAPQRMLLPLEYLGLVPGYHALFRVEPRLRQPLADDGYLTLTDAELTEASAIVARLTAELHTHTVGYEAAVQAYFLEIVLFVSRRLTLAGGERGEAAYRLAQVLTYVQQNYAQEISMKYLAQMAHLSDGHFSRLFHAATGLPPLEYLTRLRVRRAAQLVAETDRSITDIGSATGFPSLSHFSRQFRRVLGVSPREHRHRARAEAEASTSPR